MRVSGLPIPTMRVSGLPFPTMPFPKMDASGFPFPAMPFPKMGASGFPFPTMPFPKMGASGFSFPTMPFATMAASGFPFPKMPFPTMDGSGLRIPAMSVSGFPIPTLPVSGFPFATVPQAVTLPVSEAAKRRNTVLDSVFYDIGGLTSAERDKLVRETNIEGSILVVHPRGALGQDSVRKFDDYLELRAAPGELLRHFSIAGVGSSDMGAAALARSLADHLGEPVGAIVAGYGVSDLLAEALGGWFFFGTLNRALRRDQDRAAATTDGTAEETAAAGFRLSPDTGSLVRLLRDEDRQIATILGHSKGCLSIALALEAIAETADEATVERAKAAQVITTGAVVAFPAGFDRVAQFLGQLDWFGAMNSRRGVDFTSVSDAWHHVNRAIPMHMDLGQVFQQAL